MPVRPAPERRRREARATTEVFASLNAQHQNLGDLVLRREMLRLFDPLDCELHLFVGDSTPPFVEAAVGHRRVELYQSRWRWQASLVRAAVARRAVFVLAPGPQLLRDDLGGLAHEAMNATCVLVLRLLGRPSLKLGRSLRGSGALAVRIERLVSRACRVYTVRDAHSPVVLGRSVDVAPDLALAMEHLSVEDGRPFVSLSPRIGRRWDQAELSRIVAEARAEGLDSCVVSQTQFDDPFHAQLAADLGVEHVEWGDRAHTAQLDRVLGRYAMSRCVVSDRLHALVFGLVAGALPVPHLVNDDKLLPALRAIEWPEMAVDSSAPVASWLAFDHAIDLPLVLSVARESLAVSQEQVLSAIVNQTS